MLCSLQKVMPLVPSEKVPKKPKEVGDPRGWRRLFGRYLSDMRVAKGWNQTQLAEASGINQGVISGLENGNRNLHSEHIDALLEAFDVDATQMILKLADIVLHPEQLPAKMPPPPPGTTADATGYTRRKRKAAAVVATGTAPSRSEKRG